MAEITKINIKGVDYDIGGTGGGGLKVVEITETFVGETAEITLDRYNEIVGADILMYKVPIGTNELIPFLFYKNVQSGYTEVMGAELTTFTSLYNENNMLKPTLDITFTVGGADGMYMLMKTESTPVKNYKKEKVAELTALESTDWVATDNSLKYRKADALYIVNNNNVEIVFHKMTDIPLGTSFNTTFVYFQATPPNGDGSVATIVVIDGEIQMSYFTLSLDYKQPLS